MKDFEYVAPRSLREAVALLAEPGVPSRAMAGGTDLLVQLRAGRFSLDRVVDIKSIPELVELDFGPRRGLRVGAAVTCRRFYTDPQVSARYPGLTDAAAIIGGIQIQGRASLGGNLCNAAPSGDSIPALMVHGATALIAGPAGRRSLPVAQFCRGPGQNALAAGELLVALAVPPPRRHTGAHYLRFIPRREMDIAVVGVGAHVELVDRGRAFGRVSLALGAVAPTPVLAEEAAAWLAGKPVDDASIAAAAELAKQAARPISDMRGPAAFRVHLVGVLAQRALAGAVMRARGGTVLNAVQEATAQGTVPPVQRPAAAG